MTVMRTLLDHARCDTHKTYRLSCDQYEELLARCEGACEICQEPSGSRYGAKLNIDHWGHRWAVRGLLCTGCNSQLRKETIFRPEARAYLANAWWEQKCAALGYPNSGVPPEPPVGSAVQIQWGTVLVHIDEYWDGPRQCAHNHQCGPWERLYYAYGPHNLVPYDLGAAFEDDLLHPAVRFALVNGQRWQRVREALGLPEQPPPVQQERRFTPRRPRDSLPWLSTPEKTAAALRHFLDPEECRQVAELLLADDDSVTADGQVA